MNDNEPQAPIHEVVIDCELDAPPERVWRALTEPELLAAWLLPNGFRPQIGHRFGLVPDGRLPGGPIDCQVLDVQPERRLSLSWRSAEADERGAAGNRLDSVVTFDLERIAGGTRLRIAHTGIPARARVRVDAFLGAERRLTAMLARHPVTRLAA